MNKKIPLGDIKVGNKYGKLTILKIYRFPDVRGATYYVDYKCDCGNTGTVCKNSIGKGKEDCGCGEKKIRKSPHGFSSKYGTDVNRKFFNTYSGAKTRCKTKKGKNYKLYGGRGIKFMRNSFEDFKRDMYESYLEHVEKFGIKQTTIDRIDVNGNYCKENCRWATYKEQLTNRRISPFAIVDGEKITAEILINELGISETSAYYKIGRYNRNEIDKEELFKKGGHYRVFEVDGKEYTSKDLIDMCKIKKETATVRVTRYLKGEITKEQLFSVNKKFKSLF